VVVVRHQLLLLLLQLLLLVELIVRVRPHDRSIGCRTAAIRRPSSIRFRADSAVDVANEKT
jgi:hypothetical protein